MRKGSATLPHRLRGSMPSPNNSKPFCKLIANIKRTDEFDELARLEDGTECKLKVRDKNINFQRNGINNFVTILDPI